MNDATAICTQFDTVGAFADLLPPRPVSELRRLWLAAADASEALSERAALPWEREREDPEWDRLQDVADAAERELRDHLLMEFGLTTADLSRSVL